MMSTGMPRPLSSTVTELSKWITTSIRLQDAPPLLWDLERYRLVAELSCHVGRVFSARFARGDREILTAGRDGTVSSWDATSGRLRETYRGGSRYLADSTLTPDGSMVVAGGGDGLVRYWDATTARQL